jgi:hypothetical protein
MHLTLPAVGKSLASSMPLAKHQGNPSPVRALRNIGEKAAYGNTEKCSRLVKLKSPRGCDAPSAPPELLLAL